MEGINIFLEGYNGWENATPGQSCFEVVPKGLTPTQKTFWISGWRYRAIENAKGNYKVPTESEIKNFIENSAV